MREGLCLEAFARPGFRYHQHVVVAQAGVEHIEAEQLAHAGFEQHEWRSVHTFPRPFEPDGWAVLSSSTV
ncbi:MAG TPA: hypothetical protein VF283_04115 [Bryobacteraceae bacterium]